MKRTKSIKLVEGNTTATVTILCETDSVCLPMESLSKIAKTAADSVVAATIEARDAAYGEVRA